MQTITLPQGNAFYSVRVELDGSNYVLGFAWVERASLWHLAVATDEGVTLVAGIGIVTNRPLFRRFHYLDGMPPGELAFIDPTGKVSPGPGYDGLDQLWYVPEAELP